MAEQELNRTEKATPYKLKKAREKGQAAKSVELNGFIILLAFTLTSLVFWRTSFGKLESLYAGLFQMSGNIDFQINSLSHLFFFLGMSLIAVIAPVLLVLLIASILANAMQVGFVWSTIPLKPDFTRLNPVTGIKRVFNVRMIFELIKNIFKIILYGTVIYLFIRSAIPQVMLLMHTPPATYPAAIVHHVEVLLIRLLVAMGFVAIIDWLFVRWQHAKQQRMSMREMREEVKQREGDPLIRSKRRQILRELRKRSVALAKVKSADVVITNPTHIAVALQYDRKTMMAPKLVAKGAGVLAMKMKKIATQHQVPIVEDKELARALFKKINLNSYVSENFYHLVAGILARAYRVRNKS